MKCPECSNPLRRMRYEGVEIHTCDGCGGEFIGQRELVHIVRTREARFDAQLQHKLADRKPLFGVPIEKTERELTCPTCEVNMNVVNYGGDTGVFIDKCVDCGGVWLDNEELEKIQILVERWQDEAPAQIAAMQARLDEVRRLTREQSQARYAGSRFAFVNALMNRFLDAA
ncbi:MAG: hypothetical protein EA376_12310 [Phycisphaeraceae bacterium]|nr:MAG: hypothetical protein EA376_12310 [Phycisphaeraceae bacterium]